MLPMKILITLLAAFVLLTSTASAKEVCVDGGPVSFAVPEEFTPLSPAEVHAKYPSPSEPRQVMGNERRSTTIAYQIIDQPLDQPHLPELQNAYTHIYGHVIAEIDWKQNAIVELAGQKWLMMEFTSRAPGEDLYAIMLFTSYKGKMLMFTFHTTRRDFPMMEKPLRESIRSITLKP